MNECKLPDNTTPIGLFQSLVRQDTPQLTSHAVTIWASAVLMIIALGIGGSVAMRIAVSGDVGSGATWVFGCSVGAVAGLAGVVFTKQTPSK